MLLIRLALVIVCYQILSNGVYYETPTETRVYNAAGDLIEIHREVK